MMIKSIHYTFITLIRACVCASVCEFPLQQLLIGRLGLLFEECNCTCSLSGRDEGSRGAKVSSDGGWRRKTGLQSRTGRGGRGRKQVLTPLRSSS